MADEHVYGRSQEERDALNWARRALPNFDETVIHIRRLYHGGRRRLARKLVARASAYLWAEGLSDDDIERAVDALDADLEARRALN